MAQLVINSWDITSTRVSLFFLDYRYNVKLLKIKVLDYKATATSIAYLLKDRANNIVSKM
jgi:hypothetical protein